MDMHDVSVPPNDGSDHMPRALQIHGAFLRCPERKGARACAFEWRDTSIAMATAIRFHQAKPKKSRICLPHIAEADISTEMLGNNVPSDQCADVLAIAGG